MIMEAKIEKNGKSIMKMDTGKRIILENARYK